MKKRHTTFTTTSSSRDNKGRTMKNFEVGFARLCITPMLGIQVAGYYEERLADTVLDDLYVSACAISTDDDKALIISVDNVHIYNDVTDRYISEIAEKSGLDKNSIYLTCTHTHTGPLASGSDTKCSLYVEWLSNMMIDVATTALDDLTPARAAYAVGEAKNVAFVRRFRMKDGSCQTNPGVNNPDIVHSIGTADERVSVLRFDRDGAESIVIVNFACHPDVVGGNNISADWPGFLIETVEAAIPDCKCIFLNGCEGDINHVNVHPTKGFRNDLERDFDDVDRGYGHARWMGRAVAGAVLQVYDKAEYFDVDSVKYLKKTISIPSNKADPSLLPQARKYYDLHTQGKLGEELGISGMMVTTVAAEASRMLSLADAPDTFEITLSGIKVGKAALIGIPGEPFCEIGKQLKLDENFDIVVPTCLTNGCHGYFPTQDAYDEGGYEARSSRFKAGVAERLIDGGKKLLGELWNK